MAKRSIRAVADRIIVKPRSKPKSSGLGGIGDIPPDFANKSPRIQSAEQDRSTEIGTVISVGRLAGNTCCPAIPPNKDGPDIKNGDQIAYRAGAGQKITILGSTYLSLTSWDVVAVIA